MVGNVYRRRCGLEDVDCRRLIAGGAGRPEQCEHSTQSTAFT